jgi:hypothetical protein
MNIYKQIQEFIDFNRKYKYGKKITFEAHDVVKSSIVLPNEEMVPWKKYNVILSNSMKYFSGKCGVVLSKLKKYLWEIPSKKFVKIRVIALIILTAIVYFYIFRNLVFCSFSFWEKWIQVGILFTFALNTLHYMNVIRCVYGENSTGCRRLQIFGCYFPLFIMLLIALALSLLTFISKEFHSYIHYLLIAVGGLFCLGDYLIATADPKNTNVKLRDTVFEFDIPVAVCLALITGFYYCAHNHTQINVDSQLDAFISGSIAFHILFATFTFDPNVLKTSKEVKDGKTTTDKLSDQPK